MSDKITVVIDQDLEDIIPSFLENRQKDLSRIDQSLQHADFKTIESIGHKLAGNAGSYGFDELGEVGVELEKASKEENETLVRSLVAKYKDYIDRLEVVYS